MRRDTVGGAQIAAFVEGEAGREDAWGVLSAALTDRRVRRRVALLRAADAAWERGRRGAAGLGDSAAFEARAGLLATAVEEAAVAVAGESGGLWGRLTTLTRPGSRGGGLWRVGGDAAARLEELLRAGQERVLVLGRGHALGLPCLAPATASAVADVSVRRQSVTTADGVRIEFQQLPGATSRLRVVVDASTITGDAAPSDGPGAVGNDFGYNVAFLTLEEATEGFPDRHILVVMLNREGRGFTDYTVGSGAFVTGAGLPGGWGDEDALEDPGALPPPRALCSLVSASLSRLPGGGDADAYGSGGGTPMR